MTTLNEFRIVHHPKTAEVIFVAHKALVQRQIRANGVLQGETGKEEERRQN